jgi:hypothetical protein
MGTRAIISINKKPYIATHWDGYVESLGVDLFTALEKSKIAERAITHGIDFMDVDDIFYKPCSDLRLRSIQCEHELTEGEVLEGKRRGCIISCSDYLIEDIKNYNDFAEYQYDFDTSTKKWRVREVSGAWKENPTFGKWEDLIDAIKKERYENIDRDLERLYNFNEKKVQEWIKSKGYIHSSVF